MLMNYAKSKNKIMLYQTNQDLPLEVQEHLPEALQELYRAAYNSALQWYGETAKARLVAKSAVKIRSARDLSVLV